MVKLSDFPKTCRLCSKVYRLDKLVKIFSNRGISLNLKDSVNAHLPIKVVETETTMPNNVCINCIRRLNGTNEFFATVIASEKLFKRLLKKEEEKKSNRLEKHQKPDLIPITAIKRLDDSSPPKINVSEESNNTKKSDLDSRLEKNVSTMCGNNSMQQVGVNDSKYVNIVPKASHMVLENRNCNGNIIFNVGSGKDHGVKLPIEVLCCPDCTETVKIYSIEERQLFFEYLKQHSCKRSGDSEKIMGSFSEYRESYRGDNVAWGEEKKPLETGEVAKSNASSRKWPDGDLPADPGPDPKLYENIFEDDVRLDDDFHWPMPKRIRRLHRCASCEFVTKSASRLKAHQKLHRTCEKRQTSHSTSCKHCNKRFETVNEAKKHERLAHVTPVAKNSLCEYCGVMKAQKTLRDHVLKQHTVESEIEMQACDVCGKSFISPTSLYLHKKIHTIEKQHLCDLCGKAFKQRIAMRRHYMLHFPRAPPKFKCNICEKRVTTRGSLRLHMMRHTGEKPQECPECHMVMRHGLKHHMRLHSDEAPFKCVVCGADFKRRDYVRRHMRKHLNETEQRSLRCNICDHVFEDIKNFLIHHQNVHSNEIFTQIKIYDCKICSMQFADALQHKDHEELCRNGGIGGAKDCPAHVGSHPCVYCDYKSESKCAVAEDTQKVTNGVLVEQRFHCQMINSASNKLEQSRFKFNEELRRLKKQQEGEHSDQNIILTENVMSLGNDSSEYSYIDIIEKPNIRDKEILMTVDEQILTSSSVHVFENTVEEFSQSLHSHSQSQLGIHPSNESYGRESLSWKQL